MLQGTEIISFWSILTVSIQQKPNWCIFESHDTTLTLNPRKMQGFWDGKETRDQQALTVKYQRPYCLSVIFLFSIQICIMTTTFYWK